MPMRKLWDHAINTKEGFVPRKGKMYLLLREEQEEVHEFIVEQLRKGYIRLSKLPQMAPVFFVGKKDGKKWMVQDYRYCYDLKLKGLSNKTTLVLSNTRELDRVPNTK